MSATGSSRPCPLPARRGFTLIEILVVVAIIGILATSVVLVLPDSALGERRASVRAWQRQAEQAALLAEAQAQALAWEIDARSARLRRIDAGQQWPAGESDSRGEAPLGDSRGESPLGESPLLLAEGLAVTRIEIDGQPLPVGSAIVFTATPPLFVLEIAGAGRSWQIAGQPNGSITLAEAP